MAKSDDIDRLASPNAVQPKQTEVKEPAPKDDGPKAKIADDFTVPVLEEYKDDRGATRVKRKGDETPEEVTVSTVAGVVTLTSTPAPVEPAVAAALQNVPAAEVVD